MNELIGWPVFLTLIALPFVLALAVAVGREVRTWHAHRLRRDAYQRRIVRRLQEMRRG